MGLRTYKLFISHAWHRDEEYWRVVRMLNDAPMFSWENLSVPEHDPVDPTAAEPLPYLLRSRIRDCCAFIACAGMWVPHSDWILLEVEFARRIGRPIIGVPPRGQLSIPRAIAPYAKRLVSQQGTLVSAIREFALPEGK